MTDYNGGQPFETSGGDSADRRKNSVLALTMTRPSTRKDCEGERARSTFNAQTQGGVRKKGMFFFFFGVVLPVLAVLFESKYHFCAEHYFDPFPTAGHVVLFLLIPFSNFLIWLATRRDLSQHYGFMSLASGMAMGIGILYTLMFLPLTPMSCLYSLALGFGLLGLAPLLSLPCSFASGKTITRLANRKDTYFDAHQVEHIGHLIVLVMVVAVELPSTLTRVHLAEAVHSAPALSRQRALAYPETAAATDWARSGIVASWFPAPGKAEGLEILPASPKYLSALDWLRRYGNQEVLLRACYERSGKATDILGSLYESAHPIPVDEARQIFYQVTGKPYNSVPIPASFRATIKHAGVISESDPLNSGVTDEFDRDTDIAGENVSGMARGLSMTNSLMGGDIDVDGAQARLNWSFEFRNVSKYDREARMRLQLPTGAVVSKALLTVNGVTKLAQIQLKSEARARYQKAVLQHQDPLLVSSCGLDQVLVQCFPVAPGETMQVRLFIDAPCTIDARENCALPLPVVVERNFVENGPLRLDLTSTRPLQINGLGPVVPMEPALTHAAASAGGATAPPPATGVGIEVAAGPPAIGAGIEVAAAPPAIGAGSQVAACMIAMPEPVPGTSSPMQIKSSTRGDEVELLERSRLTGDGNSHLTGSLTALQLGNMEGIVRAERDKNIKVAWCPAPQLENGKVIKRTLKPALYAGVSRLYVVVDGSAVMSKHLKAVASGLKSLPSSIKATIYMVGDQSLRFGNFGFKGDEKPYLEALRQIEGLAAAGGQDDSLVLQEALARVGNEKNSAVLWIHGAQPLSPGSFVPVRQMLRSSPLRPALFDLPVSTGPNEILNGVDADTRIVSVNRSGDLADDLKNLFHSIDPSFAASEAQLAATPLQYVDSGAITETGARKVSPWLVNIFAAAEIKRQLSGCPRASISAYPVLLADSCKIVSPVSSAIVVSPNSHEYVAAAASEDRFYQAMTDFLSRVFPGLINAVGPMREASPSPYYCDVPASPPPPSVFQGQNPIDSAFNDVTRQLNSLSSAAGAPGGSSGPVVQSLKSKQFGAYGKQDVSQTRSDAFGGGSDFGGSSDAFGGGRDASGAGGSVGGGGAMGGISGDGSEGAAGRMNEQAFGSSNRPASHEPVSDAFGSSAPADKTQALEEQTSSGLAAAPSSPGAYAAAKDELSIGASVWEKKAAIDAEEENLAVAHMSGSKEVQAPAKGQRFAFQPARFPIGGRPVLQGATNGTILPQFPLFGRESARKNVGLAGAPVDPRYGQSNQLSAEPYDEKASLEKIANLFTLMVVVVGLLVWFLFFRGRREEEI